MSRNEGPASVPTAPYTVTEGVFQLAATTEYYIRLSKIGNSQN